MIFFLSHSRHNAFREEGFTNMDVRDLCTNTLNHDDALFLEKVMIDIRSYVNILNSTLEKRYAKSFRADLLIIMRSPVGRTTCFRKVLLFPPVNNFRRFLVHQLVEKTFRDPNNLGTLSIGTLYARRTVVYPAHLNLAYVRPLKFIYPLRSQRITSRWILFLFSSFSAQKKEVKSTNQSASRPIIARNSNTRVMSNTPDSKTKYGNRVCRTPCSRLIRMCLNELFLVVISFARALLKR
jgi:hypothetical protein